MTEQIWSQVSITFHDVVVYFSEEEWDSLQEWQKELYRNVMKEIHRALIALGYAIVNPDTLFRIKSQKELHFKDSHDTERKGSRKGHVSVTSVPILNPDILLRIKHEEEENDWHNVSPDGKGQLEIPSTFSVTVKQENGLYSTAEENFTLPQHSKKREPTFCPDTSLTNDCLNQFVIKEEPLSAALHTSPRCPGKNDVNISKHEKHNTLYTERSKQRQIFTVEPLLGRLPTSPSGEMPNTPSAPTRQPRKHAGFTVDRPCKSMCKQEEHCVMNEQKPEQYTEQQAQEDVPPANNSRQLTVCVEEPVLRRNISDRGQEEFTKSFDHTADCEHLHRGHTTPEISCRKKEDVLEGKASLSQEEPIAIGHQASKRVDSEKMQTAPLGNDIPTAQNEKHCTLGMEDAKLNKDPQEKKHIEIVLHFNRETGYKTQSEQLTLKRPHRTQRRQIPDTWHESIPRRPATERLYKCTTCEACFNDGATLLMHQRTHPRTDMEERLSTFAECGESFGSNTNLKFHQERHSGERPHQCVSCRKKFKKLQHLKVHALTHTGERPYSCTECHKTFRHSSVLTRHQRIHSGERPYICNMCNKSFRDSSSLNVHQRIHTGERPYKCTQCGKSYRYRPDLTRHHCSQ